MSDDRDFLNDGDLFENYYDPNQENNESGDFRVQEGSEGEGFREEGGSGDEGFREGSEDQVSGEKGKDEGDGYEMEEQKMEATFAEKVGKAKTGGIELNARSQEDKNFIVLRDAFVRLTEKNLVTVGTDFTDSVIIEMRQTQIFPFLNAIYVANAKLFLNYYKTRYTPADIKKWVDNNNKQFQDVPKEEKKKYELNIVDFIRYLEIGKKIFK